MVVQALRRLTHLDKLLPASSASPSLAGWPVGRLAFFFIPVKWMTIALLKGVYTYTVRIMQEALEHSVARAYIWTPQKAHAPLLRSQVLIWPN